MPAQMVSLIMDEDEAMFVSACVLLFASTVRADKASMDICYTKAVLLPEASISVMKKITEICRWGLELDK